MRVLLGGVIGALAAAGAWMAIEHTAKQEFGWMAIAVGLVTGYVVHKAAGAGSRGSYARGALAVVLALVACVGSRQVYAKVMAKTNSGAETPAASAEVEADSPATSEKSNSEGEETAEPSKSVISLQDQSGSGAVSFGKASLKKGISEWDMLWLSMAALTAYVVGKGRGQSAANESADESPDPAGDEPA